MKKAVRTCRRCNEPFGANEAHCKGKACPWCNGCAVPMRDELPGEGKPPPHPGHPG